MCIRDREIPSTLKTLNKNAFEGNTVAGKTQKVLLKTADKSVIENAPNTFVANGTGHQVVYD